MFTEFIIITAIVSIIAAIALALFVKKQEAGTGKMKEISSYIREGAFAYLKKQYSVLALFVLIVAAVLYVTPGIHPITSIAFILGAISSALAGFLGMDIATLANVRTANAARKDLKPALKIAFFSGAVMGLFAVGVGLFGLTSIYLFLTSILSDTQTILSIIFGFSFGASSVALFARVGGGIYTKAADVGADLVGKIEAGIPEDDPRNPAVIADNVGDNVGDVAGMGADLFESYIGSIVAAMALGFLAFSFDGLMLPLTVAAIGIISALIGIIYFNFTVGKNIRGSLRNGTIVAAALMAILTFIIINSYFKVNPNLSYSIIAGLIAGIIIGYLTEYYTSHDFAPTKKIAESATTGTATNFLTGFSIGSKSTALPILTIAIAIALAYNFGNLGASNPIAGVYGIALAGVGMLSTLGITLAVDAYGPVADNAGGIAEMSGLEENIRKRTDALDAAGNTTAAIGKGFAIGSAALTALALFNVYSQTTGTAIINIVDWRVIIGLFIGGMLPFLFASLAIEAVSNAAQEMIQEVRRQFKEIKGLLKGKAKADYKKCVEISTNAAIKKMIAPGLLAILSPIVVGIILGAQAVGGLLAGALVSGVVLAIMMANSGGAWDNAKKYIELGNFGGKGSEAHKSAIAGDTVGDPFKDTAGPSLNILIKLMSIVSLLFAVLFI